MVIKRNFEKYVKSEIITGSRYDVVIGIDPDVDLNGVAILFPDTRSLETHKLPFAELTERLIEVDALCVKENKSLLVIVEAGWLNHKSGFHQSQGKGAERIAKNVGANHQVGKLIAEVCRHNGIEVLEQAPLRKCWRGRDGKITHAELSAFTKISGRTNQEERDAALIAWNYAHLPIKINPRIIK